MPNYLQRPFLTILPIIMLVPSPLLFYVHFIIFLFPTILLPFHHPHMPILSLSRVYFITFSCHSITLLYPFYHLYNLRNTLRGDQLRRYRQESRKPPSPGKGFPLSQQAKWEAHHQASNFTSLIITLSTTPRRCNMSPSN